MTWLPNKEEENYIKLIIGMSTDCLLQKGTDNIKTYINNLKMIISQLEEISKKEGL